MILPSIYFWACIKRSSYAPLFYSDTSSYSKQVGSSEFITRMTLVVCIDIMSNETLPLLLFGTKDLDIVPDILIKRILAFILTAGLCVGPVDGLLIRLFR